MQLNFKIGNKVVLLLFAISVLGLFFLYKTGNLFSTDSGYNNSTKSSFIDFGLKIVRFFPVASLIIILFFSIKRSALFSRKLSVLYSIIFLSISLIVFNPVSGTVGRYLVLATYLCIISVVFHNAKNNSILLIGIFLGFTLIFPSLNFFKYHSFVEINKFEFTKLDLTENDYDAYFMFMSTIRFCSNKTYSFGNNILSSIVSFIPRSLWSWKAEPSGFVISSGNDALFTNVSCPLFAEFYFAFGIIGVVVLTILFAYLVKFLDVNKNKNILVFGVNSILIGNILPLMRGAMLPVTSFITALILSYFLCYSLVKLISSKGVIYYARHECCQQYKNSI